MQFLRTFHCGILASLLCLACGKSIQERPELQELFTQQAQNGVLALYDVQSNIFELYNFAKYRDSAFVDFKAAFPLIALMAVETGILNTEQSVPKGLKINLAEALKTQDSVFFAQVLSRLDSTRLTNFLDTINFGLVAKNLELKQRLYQNRLTFDQLLGFIKKVYAGNFPFQQRSYDIVARAMFSDNNTFSGDIRYYSWDNLAGNKALLGWVEVRKRPYFFILAVPKDLPISAVALLHEALEKLKLFIR